jgi:hypothetical protein
MDPTDLDPDPQHWFYLAHNKSSNTYPGQHRYVGRFGILIRLKKN